MSTPTPPKKTKARTGQNRTSRTQTIAPSGEPFPTDTYEVLDADGNWQEVTWKDPRLQNVRRLLGTKLTISKGKVRKQFHQKAYDAVGVTREFFNETKRTFRGLGDHPALWQLMEYLCFLAHPDKKTGLLPIPQSLLAKLENKFVNHYKGEVLLKLFQRRVMTPETFQFSDWEKGRCRQVTKFELPAHYKKALEKQKNSGKSEVFFCGGQKYSARAVREMAQRKKLKQQLADSARMSASSKEIADYMNNSNPKPFRAIIRRNYQDALAVAKAITDRKKRQDALLVLEAIKKDPQPYYGPSREGHTARLFALGRKSLLQLNGDVRKELTRGWDEADLRSAHLAVNARMWGVDRLIRFLEEDGNIWELFYEHFDIPPKLKDKVKKVFKGTIYAIWFDRDPKLIGVILTNDLKKKGVERDGTIVYSMPFIRDIIEERERAKRRIVAEGGVTDCNGRFISLKRREPSSLMAEAAQAVEVELILQAIRLAKTTEDFQITLIQHDGFSVDFRKDKDVWQGRIERAIAAKAETMEIPTGLEWEET
jgi:hypothetical protein